VFALWCGPTPRSWTGAQDGITQHGLKTLTKPPGTPNVDAATLWQMLFDAGLLMERDNIGKAKDAAGLALARAAAGSRRSRLPIPE
jgi:hypothetical protein